MHFSTIGSLFGNDCLTERIGPSLPMASRSPARAKNAKTLWRDAEKLIGEDGALQMVDPLCVIETCMRYFYSLAQTGRKANAPLDEVRKCFEKAAHLAALAAPYRHPRLSAVKLNKDPVDPALRQEASLEESRYRSIGSGWPRCSTWKRWSPPVTALPIGRCKRDDVAQFPIGLLTLIGTGCVATKRGTVF